MGEKGIILKKVYDLSDKVIAYGAELQNTSNKRQVPPITRGALERLHESTITYHRAVLCLAENGWAQNSNPLLRTMIELIINSAVITEKDFEIRSFRYFAFENLRIASTPAERELTKEELREYLFGYLSKENRQSAENYMAKEQYGNFWYSDIYHGPTDVLQKIAPVCLHAYNMGSSAVHGGQIGYKFFDQQKNLRAINARQDSYSANLSAIFSIRHLLEFSMVRDRFEGANLKHYYKGYVQELSGLKSLFESAGVDKFV